MVIINYCVCCYSKRINKTPGVLFDFFAYRLFGYDLAFVNSQNQVSYQLHFRINIIHCLDCNYTGSDMRPDEDELLNVYQDYRSETYTADRDRFEPGYKNYNYLLGKGENELNERRLNIEKLFLHHLPLKQLKVIIDYGGDEGQFLPTNLNGARLIVFDPSDKKVLSHVEKIEDYSKLPLANLIMCCHTLEHVSYPVDLLKKISNKLLKKSYIYIELPLEVQNNSILTQNELPTRIHEHINTFTTSSVIAMMQTAGLKPMLIYEATINSESLGSYKILSALCHN